MDWSKDGGVLAIVHTAKASVILWDAASDRASQFDTGEKKGLSFIKWAQQSMTLAVGTTNGTLVLYNHQTSRKIPVLGKHGNKEICAGAWSIDDQLCLGGLDKMCTLSGEDGTSQFALPLQSEPAQIQFHESLSEDGEERVTTVSIMLGRQTLYLWSSAEPENPIELEFQSKYGSLVGYRWFGEDKIMLGFSDGYFIVVTTNLKHIGQELFQSVNHQTRLNDICASLALNKAATCGDDTVVIRDLDDPRDVFGKIVLEDERGLLDKLAWSDDGQLLTITTQNGAVYTYLTKLPQLAASSGTRVCNLTGLREICICDPANPDEPRLKTSIPVEPSFVAVGPYHAAAGLNANAWFYAISDDGSVQRLNSEKAPRSYLGTVEKIVMNSVYAAVLTDGRLQLELIESDAGNLDDDRESILFPTNKQESARITCCAITPAFCIWGTSTGGLFYFLIEDWITVNEFRHEVAIRMVFPDPAGGRLVFVDDKGDTLLYSPVDDAVIQVPNTTPTVQGVFWDQQAPNEGCFVVYDDKTMDTYVYQPEYYTGPRVVKIGSTRRPHGVIPVTLINGAVVCVSQSGKVTEEKLSTHQNILRADAEEHPKGCTMQNVELGRFAEAFVSAVAANDDECWAALYTEALKSLNIATAYRCAQAQGNPGMAAALAKLQHIEDIRQLSGHVALILGEVAAAEKHFLASSEPTEALKMYRDLLEWKRAMELAKEHAPDQIPYISREYGQQLEFSGSFVEALNNYEAGLTDKAGDERHNSTCRAGMARMLLRNGDLRNGLELVAELSTRQVWRDCAAILQASGHLSEAAEMFEKGGLYDKAAALLIRLKNWAKMGTMLKNVGSTKLLTQYAKAREADGSYLEAAAAYERAGAYDTVIKINLEKLSNPDEAVRIVKETGSTEGAKMVAKFFMKLGDPGSAIQFLVISGASDDAFALAQSHGKVDVYCDVLGDDGTVGDYRSIALYYEKSMDPLKAGHFYYKGKQHKKALDLLLRATDAENQHIDLAIEVVGSAKEDALTQQLIDYVMGESDNNPKDAKYLFKLYIALKQFPEAARTAVIIAREEQSAGNYRNAHGVLFQMHQTLQGEDIRIPMDMSQNLMMLHSYIIVKMQIKQDEHLKAARMLVRVAESISSFPAHVVNILTSTVIECWKSGLKDSAFRFAAMLMRPEYKRKLDPKYKAKIEKIVRKPDKSEIEEEMTPCPFCGSPVLQTELDCGACGNQLPFCIVTGYHMVADDYSQCPSCKFPALYSEFQKLLSGPPGTDVRPVKNSPDCPMCSVSLMPTDVTKITDPSSLLRKFKTGADASAKQGVLM